MADETENTEIEETPDAPEAEAENVVEDAAPEAEPVAEVEPVAEAEAEPVAEAEAESAAVEEPAGESEPAPAEDSAEEAEPLAAEVESVAEEAAAADDEPATEADEAPAEAAAVSGPKPKRKRLPRSERPKKTRPKRVPAAERKSITRLPKPEHERGRRQERQGTVVSAAADKTIVVRVDVVKLHPRYKKVVRRSTRLHAHDEENQAKLGDVVRIVETRPLSRMKRWRLQEIVEAAK
jgi:small subunit ribosomal protein S17